MASQKSRTKRSLMDVISFTIPGRDTYQMTVKEIVSKIEKDRTENMDEAVQTLIAVWTTISCRTEHLCNVADIFHSLFRKTSLTVLSVRWIKVTSAQKRQMAKVLTKCSQVFGPLVEKATRLCTVLVMAVYDPWGEPALNQLVEGQIDFTDASEFVNSEPEELLLTRVESLTEAGHVNAAIQLCKSCLKHCTAIMTKGEQSSQSFKKREKDKALPFIESMLILLHNQGDYGEIIKEASKLKCHDGVNLIEEISSKCLPGNASLPEMLTHFFLARDINLPSTYCCTKDLMNLWCKLQLMQQRSVQDICNSAQRLICHAPSSAHFYLFVDRLWHQFGDSLLPLYLEMYVRGLTSDMNFLDVVRVAGPPEKITEVESHLAFIFTKLASMFSGIYDEIALECLLTAFSFSPAKEKIDKIHKMKEQVSKRINSITKPFNKCADRDNGDGLTAKCACEGRCFNQTKDSLFSSERARPVYKYHFPHSVLDGEIKGVPYFLLEDFVSVLECMRYRHLKAADDWETLKRRCHEYLEKYTAPKATEPSNDSADSEMDSVSDEGDENISEIKIPTFNELSHEQGISIPPLSGKFRRELKNKTYRKQKDGTEDNSLLESQDASRHLSAYNDVDKEIRKRKKKRKTKREKDREAISRRGFEEHSKPTLVLNRITDGSEKQFRYPLQSSSGIKNDFADLSNKEIRGSTSEEVSLPSESIQNKNLVVVLSDILSENIIDTSKNDGVCKNDFQCCSVEIAQSAESDIRKELPVKENDQASDTVCSSDNTVPDAQKMLSEVMESNNEVKADCILNSTLSSACISNVHPEVPTVEQNSLTVLEESTSMVISEEPSVANTKLENHSLPNVLPDVVEVSADSTASSISKDKGMSENEKEKKKDDPVSKPTVQVICTTVSSNCTVTPIPLDSLPKKLQVQIEQKGGIPPMSSMATLSIPLPVGVKHSGGNKILSGRLVIPVNRLQRAVGSGSNNSIKIEGDANSNKQQMLSIPNVILMKRNISSDVSDEETGSKKMNVNRGSKNQKRLWATVRNLHGSIEWRKVSEGDGNIPFQQKPICAAKLRSGGVALSGPLYVSSGREEDKNDLPLVTTNVLSSCAATTLAHSPVSVPISSSAVIGNSQSTLTDTMPQRNDTRIMSVASDVSSTSFPAPASVTDFGIVQSKPLVVQPLATKPAVTGEDHGLNFISGIDNICSAETAVTLPVITRTTVLKDSSQSTGAIAIEKGGAKNIIRLTTGEPGICESKINFPLLSSIASGIKSCPQMLQCNSNVSQTDPDLPVNLSMPKKLITVSSGNSQYPATIDNKHHSLHQAQVVTNSCKIDLGLPVEHNALFNKASSTLQMLLANSTASPVEQRKCNELTSVNRISSAGTQNNLMSKSVSITSSAMSTNLPLDFKKAYPTTNMNCFVGLSPLNTPSSSEAKLSAIVANNTSRMKKEQTQKTPAKDNSFKPTEKDNKEPFDVVKLIGQIRELANAEAEKAAKEKEKLKSQKDAKGDKRNRKLSKKTVDCSVKLDPLAPTKKYNCVLCTSSLTQKYGLRRHYRDVHGMEVSAEQSSESIVKQFNDITSNPDGTYVIKSTKRSRIKAVPQKNIVSGSSLSATDAAENVMQKTHQALPGMDVAFPHLNIFHQTSSHAVPMPSHQTTQHNVVPMFPSLSTSASYYPQQSMNSSILNWNDNKQAIVSAEKTLEAMILDPNFYSDQDSEKPLPDLGDCHQVLNDTKQTFSASDTPLSIPSSFCTDNISFKNTHSEHESLSTTDTNKNSESSLLTASASMNVPVAYCEKLQDIDGTYKISTSKTNFDVDNKPAVHIAKDWCKDLKQISVNCVKLDSVCNQPLSSLETVNTSIDTVTSLPHLETDYFSSYNTKRHGERTVDGSLDNAVDSEVSELVAFMLHIGNKPYSQQTSLDSDGEVKEDNQYKQDKSSDDGKSETLKSMRQRTRIRHSPNSSLKRSCPCCRDSETSISAKRCRNMPNISKMARPPTTAPWLNIDRTNMQQRKSRKSLPPITRSSKRLRTRSSTTSLT